LANIIPKSINGLPHIAAFDDAFRAAMEAINIPAVLLHLSQQVPAGALDALIEQWGIDAPGFNVKTASEATKRRILEEAALLNSKRGTTWAIRYIFEAFGMPEIHVVEAAELNALRYHNGTFYHSGTITHGYQWLWAEYGIVIYVDNMTATMSTELIEKMQAGLLAYMPARDRNIGMTSRIRMPEEIGVSDTLIITFS